MKVWRFIVLVFIPLLAFFLLLPVKAAPLKEGDFTKAEYVPDEIIVKFKGDERPFQVIKVPQGKIREKIKEYQGKREVEYAEPNYIAYALMVPNDLYYKYQWHLDNPVFGGIEMEEAWDVSTGSSSVVVAVVDTGIAYENYGKYCRAPDFAQTCFVSGYDFVNNNSHPNDDNNHGTHVAGTIAQSTNNSLGVAGVAFNTCLMPVKVLNSTGSGTYTQVANGIYFAADKGAKVINLSLGGSSSSDALKNAVKYAYEKGVTVIAACGNDNKSNCLYPAAYDDYVIAVGATQYDETKAPYSNYGPSLDLVAPGGNTGVDQNKDGYGDGVLQQTFKNSWSVCSFGYYFFQGTSMATPHISGVSALLIASGKATGPNEVRTVLQTTAEDLGSPGKDNTFGWGLVNAAAALGASPIPTLTITPMQTVTPTVTPTLSPIPTPTATPTPSLTPTPTSEVTPTPTLTPTPTAVPTITLTPTPTPTLAPEVMCWKGTYQYLYRDDSQAKKFCKCAQGSYGYNSYKYNRSIKTVYKYVDTTDNTNWDVTSLSSYGPIYGVTCTDGVAYPTNNNYYWPK